MDEDWRGAVYKPKSMDNKRNSKTWIALRERVFKRDGYKCKACGSELDLTAHHIIPRSQGGKDIMRNLETLCIKCHDKIEIGEDIYEVEPEEFGERWQEWVYGGKRNPLHENTW